MSSRSSFTGSVRDQADEDEYALQWAAIDRLPTYNRLRSSLFYQHDNGNGKKKQREVVDVTKLGAVERHMFIETLIKHIENDNLRLLHKQKERTDRVNVKQPTIEVRYKNLCVEAVCEVADGKPLPTLWNTVKSWFSILRKLIDSKSHKAKISIIRDVSGIIKPSRMTLLLGPPGCGKTTFLLALAGKLEKSLQAIQQLQQDSDQSQPVLQVPLSVRLNAEEVLAAEIVAAERANTGTQAPERHDMDAERSYVGKFFLEMLDGFSHYLFGWVFVIQ